MARKKLGRPREKPVKVADLPPLPDERLFEDLEAPEAVQNVGIFEDVPTLSHPAPMTIVPTIEADNDLTEDQRQQFVKLLDTKMTLEERAEQLVELARFTDTKRAPVGLRAIMEINRITGLTVEKPTEAPSMFQLPPDTRVSVVVEKVDK